MQGIATGSAESAVVGGISPYANLAIKQATEGNDTANIMAHAVLGAIEAYATGNNAAAGAVGAASGELAAKIITEQLYGTTADNLTEEQKETVSALSQIAAGLSGALVGDNTQSAVVSAEIGKRVTENNWLGHVQENPDVGNGMFIISLANSRKTEAEKYAEDVTIPHYVSVNAAYAGVSGKLAINTRTGDVFGGYDISADSNAISKKIGLSAEIGWISGLSINDTGKNLNDTINNTLSGYSIGVKGCYFVCLGKSETISKKTRTIYSLGTGFGISTGGDYMEKINGE